MQMADVVPPEVRSRMMSGIRGTHTKPELLLRKGLHEAGFRYTLHARLPGRPDMVFPRRKAVLFAHGCFWHNHGCHLFKWPKSRPEFWQTKIIGNAKRDVETVRKLTEVGWRVGIIWECCLKGKNRLDIREVISSCSRWLRSDDTYFELAGHTDAAGSSVRLLRRSSGQDT